MLAAAACASARSLSELLPVALESVRLAFRTGTLAGKMNDVSTANLYRLSHAPLDICLGAAEMRACFQKSRHICTVELEIVMVDSVRQHECANEFSPS